MSLSVHPLHLASPRLSSQPRVLFPGVSRCVCPLLTVTAHHEWDHICLVAQARSTRLLMSYALPHLKSVFASFFLCWVNKTIIYWVIYNGNYSEHYV